MTTVWPACAAASSDSLVPVRVVNSAHDSPPGDHFWYGSRTPTPSGMRCRNSSQRQAVDLFAGVDLADAAVLQDRQFAQRGGDDSRRLNRALHEAGIEHIDRFQLPRAGEPVAQRGGLLAAELT